MSNMTGAIIFLPKDQHGTLMLEDILFEPAASWLSQSLQAAGISRFLIVCHSADRDAASAIISKRRQGVARRRWLPRFQPPFLRPKSCRNRCWNLPYLRNRYKRRI